MIYSYVVYVFRSIIVYAIAVRWLYEHFAFFPILNIKHAIYKKKMKQKT